MCFPTDSFDKVSKLYSSYFSNNLFQMKWGYFLEAATTGVLRNFSKLPGKHLRQSLFFNKVAGLRPVTFLKRDFDTSVLL